MLRIKTCDRYMLSNSVEYVLGCSMIFLILLKIVSRIFISNSNVSGLLGCLYLIPGPLWFMFCFRRKMEGYQLKSNKIIFYRFFKKKSLNYSELSHVVISVAWRNTRSAAYIGRTIVKNGKLSVKNYPWITLCKTEPVIWEKRWDREVIGSLVDNAVGRENFLYSFVWRENNFTEDMLSSFQGTYYITYSIYARYFEEVEEIIEKYKISKERIFIIKDCVNYQNFYRDINFEKVNAAVMQYYGKN